MSSQTEKGTYTHDDGIKKTKHDVIVKKSDGNTRTYHGGGGKSSPHTTVHKDGKTYRRNK